MPPWPDPRFPPSPYYRFLRVLAQSMQPSLSVELGLCGGGGSFHLCEGWPAGTVVGVEHSTGDSQQQDNWRHIVDRHANFVLWRGDSVASADAIAAIYGKASILFIDTIHTTERTKEEFGAWLPHLADRAVVLFDDVQRREMAGLWEWVPWQKARIDALHPGGLDEHGYGDGGFGVAWRG
jgi:predicted O-methyltransferase YrrM